MLSGRGFFHRHGRELFIGLIEIAVAPVGDAEAEARIQRQILRRGVVKTAPVRGGEPTPAPDREVALAGATERVRADRM